jgi:hypothetical protein
MRAYFLTLPILLFYASVSFGQCCAGGSGSPVAGGTSQGVLAAHQFEINTNYQFINSDQFYTGDSRDTNKYFDQYKSVYQYFRVAYGVTNNFMMSVETGYYFYKEEIGLHNDPSKTFNSSGISDIIIFPRYVVFNQSNEKSKSEVTVGLGYKIPVGTYNDSTGIVEPFSGNTYYIDNPQAVQPTSGAQDIIFYTFLYHGFPAKNFRIFANAMYIMKGWNPKGEKVGNFGSLSLFAGKSFYKYFGVTLQVRGELMGQTKVNKDILLYAFPNFDPEATGYKKVFVTPQLSFTKGQFTLYALADLPVYQYMTKTQVGTKFQFTTGLSFRFFAMKSKFDQIEMGEYFCPMHPEVTSSFAGECPKCGMELEKKK